MRLQVFALDDFKGNVTTYAKENHLKDTRVNQIWRICIQCRKLIRKLKLLETKYSKKPTWEIKTEIEYVWEFLDDLHSHDNISLKEPYNVEYRSERNNCSCLYCMRQKYSANLIAQRSQLCKKIEYM